MPTNTDSAEVLKAAGAAAERLAVVARLRAHADELEQRASTLEVRTPPWDRAMVRSAVLRHESGIIERGEHLPGRPRPPRYHTPPDGVLTLVPSMAAEKGNHSPDRPPLRAIKPKPAHTWVHQTLGTVGEGPPGIDPNAPVHEPFSALNPSGPDICAECGKSSRSPRTLCWRCGVDDEPAGICQRCVPIHKARHASWGDLDDSQLDDALAEYDRRVTEVMSADPFADTQPRKITCSGCGKPVAIHIAGKCLRCWRASGRPGGRIEVVGDEDDDDLGEESDS